MHFVRRHKLLIGVAAALGWVLFLVVRISAEPPSVAEAA